MIRTSAPELRPVSLTIAGSDSGGGAGIQADIKTMEARGAFATSVITSVTAQNTRGVRSAYTLLLEEIEAQYEAVVSDFDVRAVKTGMLAEAPVVERVTEWAADVDAPVVVDPVMIATSGDRLLEPAGEDAYEALIRESTLVTPNADEAAVLTDVRPVDAETAREAGEVLVDRGATAALVKGGHVEGESVRDVLVTGDDVEEFVHPRIATDATHGSGCTLSSAIAANLAQGESLKPAVERGVEFTERAVRYPLDVGAGSGSVHHLAELRERAARQPTAERVEAVVRAFVDADVGPLVPEVGMNVVGATPYAESVGETAAVEGRITRTLDGVHPNRGVRFGASSHVARFLLATRERDPSLRFAVNCRFDGEVEAALPALDGPVSEFERAEEPEDVKAEEGSTMGWGARRSFERVDGTPVAVVDRGEVGKEAIVKLLADDAETLRERTLSLLGAVAAGG
nr:bifunctional hydroxymethylpyrimidine kinase/phosphomethylpyrimidine kinase [Halobaculum halophilum]